MKIENDLVLKPESVKPIMKHPESRSKNDLQNNLTEIILNIDPSVKCPLDPPRGLAQEINDGNLIVFEVSSKSLNSDVIVQNWSSAAPTWLCFSQVQNQHILIRLVLQFNNTICKKTASIIVKTYFHLHVCSNSNSIFKKPYVGNKICLHVSVSQHLWMSCCQIRMHCLSCHHNRTQTILIFSVASRFWNRKISGTICSTILPFSHDLQVCGGPYQLMYLAEVLGHTWIWQWSGLNDSDELRWWALTFGLSCQLPTIQLKWYRISWCHKQKINKLISILDNKNGHN